MNVSGLSADICGLSLNLVYSYHFDWSDVESQRILSKIITIDSLKKYIMIVRYLTVRINTVMIAE